MADITATLSQSKIIATKVHIVDKVGLEGLTNVTLTSPTDGSYIIFRSSDNQFINDNTIVKTSTGITLTGELAATSLDISGNADIDGVLETDSLTINTNQASIADTGIITSKGLIVDNGDVNIKDAADINGATTRLAIGTGDDLLIYHFNNDSYIKEVGTGSLIIQSDIVTLKNHLGNQILSTDLDTAQLFYATNGSNPVGKLQTAHNGVSVFGSLILDDGVLGNSGNTTTLVENASSDITLTLPSSTGTLALSGASVATTQLTGTVTNAQLAGSIANDKLANNTVSYGGISLALGATDATPAFNLQDATGYPTSSLVGTITNAQLAGSIANAKLANSTITVSDGSNTSPVALGGTLTFAATSNEVTVVESAGTVTIGLPNDVTIAGDLSVSTAPTSGAHVTNKTYVDAQVAGVVDSAPAALNTLNELAAALGDDANFATSTATTIGEKLAKASNLSDLANAGTARTNLGLGNVEDKSSATIRGEIVDGDIPSTIARDSELSSFITASSTDTLTNKSISGEQINSGTIAAARVATLNQDTTGTAAKVTVTADSSLTNSNLPVVFHDESNGLRDLTGEYGLTFNPSTGFLNSGSLSLISTEAAAGTTENPVLELYRKSGTGLHNSSDNDELGAIRFFGINDAANPPSVYAEKIQYGSIYSEIADASDGTEDGRIRFDAITAGTNAEVLSLEGAGSTFYTPLSINSNFAEIVSTDAGATPGPVIGLYRNSASPAVNDRLGSLRFFGENASGEKVFYSGIDGMIGSSVNDGSHIGAIRFTVADGTSSGSAISDIAADVTTDEDPTMTLFKYGLVMNAGNDFQLANQNDVLRWQDTGSHRQELQGRQTETSGGDSLVSMPDVATGTLISTGNLSDITSTGTLSSLTVGGTTTITGALVHNQIGSNIFEIIATDTGAGVDPIISLHRNSASPAAGDLIGEIQFNGEDSATNGNKTLYAAISGRISDETDPNEEDGQLFFHLAKQGVKSHITSIFNYGVVHQPGIHQYLTGTGKLQIAANNSSSQYTALYAVTPTANRTVLLPDADGTVITSGNLSDITSTGTLTSAVTISTSSTASDLILKNTEASSADASPIIEMWRSHGTDGVADNGDIGKIEFYGDNQRGLSSGGPEKTLFGSMFAEVVDGSDGTEDGQIKFTTIKAGTSTDTFTINASTSALSCSAFEITDTSTTANPGPNISLFRDSSSPANSDELGRILFLGRNDAGEKTLYGYMRAKISSGGVDDGGEQAEIRFGLVDGGSGVDNTVTDLTENSDDIGPSDTNPLTLSSAGITTGGSVGLMLGSSGQGIRFEGSNLGEGNSAYENFLRQQEPTQASVNSGDNHSYQMLPRGSGVLLRSRGSSQIDDANVDKSADTVTFSSAHGLRTGDQVVYNDAYSTSLEISNVDADSQTFFAIVTSTTAIKLASTLANALAGTALDIDDDGADQQSFLFPHQMDNPIQMRDQVFEIGHKTTTERDALAAPTKFNGALIYNDTTESVNAYVGGNAWGEVEVGVLASNAVITGTAIAHGVFTTYRGKKVVFTGSSACTIGLPDAAAGDIGATWTICNAGSANVIFDLDAAAAQTVKILTGAAVTDVGTDNPHIVPGGVASLICTAADNYILFGSGVVDN